MKQKILFVCNDKNIHFSFKGLYLCGIYATLLFILFICPYLYAEHDSSLRIDQNIYCTIDKQFQFQYYVFEQFDKKMKDYDYFEFGTGLQYQTPATWLTFIAYYQQSYSENYDNTWLIEKKPSISMNISFIVYYFKFSNQIRYEYRIATEWHNYRVKNYLKISLYDKFLQPYTGWELYYEDRDRQFMLNRIKIGINGNIYKSISLGTYYRIDFSKINNQWEFSKQLIGIQTILKY